LFGTRPKQLPSEKLTQTHQVLRLKKTRPGIRRRGRVSWYGLFFGVFSAFQEMTFRVAADLLIGYELAARWSDTCALFSVGRELRG
jgi:hypothetical protein